MAIPCVFLSVPNDGERTVLFAWRVDQGSSGDVKLDGLNVALAVHSPGHINPWGSWNHLFDESQ